MTQIRSVCASASAMSLAGLLFWVPLLISGCGPASPHTEGNAERADTQSVSATQAPLRIATVNYPLAWMASEIGGELVAVSWPGPAGVDPAHWQPSAKTVLNYQRADLILRNGAGYAGWLQSAALSPNRVINTTRGLESRFVDAGGVTHSHGPGGAHDHGDVASHTWLDPTLAAAQAEVIAGALGRHRPESSAVFADRAAALSARLAQVDAALATAFAGLAPIKVFYSHPVYQYLDARYALSGTTFIWEPDEHPAEADWRRLEAAVNPQALNLMLWEAAPLRQTADRLQSMGVQIVVFETGANPAKEISYSDVFEGNLARLRRQLKAQLTPLEVP